MLRFDGPCKKDCKERTATCKFDGSCTKYQEWKSAFDAERDSIYKMTCADGECVSFLAYHKKRRASESSVRNNMKGTR